MLSALRTSLQQESPTKLWKKLPTSKLTNADTKPATILLLAKSLREKIKVQQYMRTVSAEQFAQEEIECQFIRSFLCQNSDKLRESHSVFVGYPRFLSWCEEIEVFFPDESKSKGKKAQKKVNTFGVQLEKASIYLLPEEIYFALYQELKLLAPSDIYTPESFVNLGSSYFNIKKHPEIKVTIENILRKYRGYMEKENLFDPAVADLSLFQLPRSTNDRKYTHIIWSSDETIPFNLQPYLEKITDTLITYLPLDHPLSTQEACEEIKIALSESSDSQPLFLDTIVRKQFLKPSFIQEMLPSDTHQILLYRIFSIDVDLMVETLEALRLTPEILIDFICFIFSLEVIEDASLFMRVANISDRLMSKLEDIFAWSVCAERFLADYHLVLVDLIEHLDLGSPRQTILLNILMTSVNAKFNFPLTLDYYSGGTAAEVFVGKYGDLLDCLMQKHGELDASDAHKEISQLIGNFAYLFAKKSVEKKQHSITLYRKVMRIFENKEINGNNELLDIITLFQKIHHEALMETYLLTDTKLRKLGKWEETVWDNFQALWDALRGIYAAMIDICSRITSFTNFFEHAIHAYVFFKEQLQKFPLLSRPEEYVQYANLYIQVWVTFKAELEVSQTLGIAVVTGFFEKVLDFSLRFPVNKHWPKIFQDQVEALKHSIFPSSQPFAATTSNEKQLRFFVEASSNDKSSLSPGFEV